MTTDASEQPALAPQKKKRLASVDWMRGVVMVLMVIDHASMAYNGDRVSRDSAATFSQGDPIPHLEFFVRWITHLCAPTFLFLAGVALAISIERRVQRGMEAKKIDRDILTRGFLVFLVDPTLISFGVRIFSFQVMYAIGVAMMCMAFLRRLPSSALLIFSVGWLVGGEILTGMVWNLDEGSSSIPAALLCAWFVEPDMHLRIIYPLLPWLAMMTLGWVYGRHLLAAREGKAKLSPAQTMFLWGAIALAIFAVVRYFNAYGNMWLFRDGASWAQWLHVSKYPPSLSFSALELGILFIMQGLLMVIEPKIGVRDKGVLLVYGQTAFFFYVAHRFVFDVTANWFGTKGMWSLPGTLIASSIMLIALYPCCLWHRAFKKKHPETILRFF